MTRSHTLAVTALAVAFVFSLAGCSDSDRTLPSEGIVGWTVSFAFALDADPAPVTAEVTLIVESTLGRSLPDGTVVRLESSLWSYDNGRREIEVSTVGGRATAILVIDQPGSGMITGTFAIDGKRLSASTGLTVRLDGGAWSIVG